MKQLVLACLVVFVLFFATTETQALEFKDITNLFKGNQVQTEVNKEEFLEQTKIGQEKFHEPIVNGEKIESKAYLTIPFSRDDVQKGNIKIEEGWLYAFDEYHIHDMEVHAGVDFSAPYGTLLYAPADGYAMSSYHNRVAKNRDKQILKYEGKEIKYGLGLFVRMYIPSANRLIDLAHLSEIDESITFSEPEFDEEEKIWKPTGNEVLVTDIPSHPKWIQVKKGQIMGKIGTSGLGWGYEDFAGKPERKITFDPSVNTSWDEPHLHFEEFSQIKNPEPGEKAGQKVAPRDIFGIYSYKKDYPSLNQKLDQRLNPLILTDNIGLPLFAK